MSNIEYDIKRLEEFYNGYKSIKDPVWIIKLGLPWMEEKLAELYSVRDMQAQHTYKQSEDAYHSINTSNKYLTQKPHKPEHKIKKIYANKALPPETQGALMY